MSYPTTSSARRTRSRAALLAEVHRRGSVTRAELAAALGLSRSAVAAGVQDLHRAGLVVEVETARTPGGGSGRTASVLRPAVREGWVLGIDCGHTHVRVALATTSGEVVGEHVARTDTDGDALGTLDAVTDLVEDLLRGAGVRRDELAAAVAGLPLSLDGRGEVRLPQTVFTSWGGLSPAEEFRRRLGMDVHLENDADLGAVGEHRYGAGMGSDDVLYVKVSGAVGAGLVLDGRLRRGSAGFAGHLGHTEVPGSSAPCRCGARGCLNAVASAEVVRRRLDGAGLGGAARDLAAAGAHPVGARVLAEAGRAVGLVVAAGCSWLAPEVVALGGELGASGQAFVDGVRDVVERSTETATALSVRVLAALLGDRAEVMGAVGVAVEHARLPDAAPERSGSRATPGRGLRR